MNNITTTTHLTTTPQINKQHHHTTGKQITLPPYHYTTTNTHNWYYNPSEMLTHLWWQCECVIIYSTSCKTSSRLWEEHTASPHTSPLQHSKQITLPPYHPTTTPPQTHITCTVIHQKCFPHLGWQCECVIIYSTSCKTPSRLWEEHTASPLHHSKQITLPPYHYTTTNTHNWYCNPSEMLTHLWWQCECVIIHSTSCKTSSRLWEEHTASPHTSPLQHSKQITLPPYHPTTTPPQTHNWYYNPSEMLPPSVITVWVRHHLQYFLQNPIKTLRRMKK